MSITADRLHLLKAEFAREAISWRAQNVTASGDKALALAYIDARDVMNRLDEVCGPENWQDSYFETAKGRVIGTISINVDGVWISKSDGAGETDVEGDKGGMSDSLKRTAVKWGIGRYLYDIESPWVGCESYDKNGKKHWKRWSEDPWSKVRRAPAPRPPAAKEPVPAAPSDSAELLQLRKTMRECTTPRELAAWFADHKRAAAALNERERDPFSDEYFTFKNGIEKAALVKA